MAIEETLATVGVVVNIGAALGVFAYVRRMFNQTARNSRILLGEPDVKQVGGLTEMVYRHQEEIVELQDRFDPSHNHDMRTDGSHPPLPREIQKIAEIPPPTMNPIDWLRRRITEAGAYRESDTERDGFVSYAAESHAIGYGVALGATVGLSLLGYPEPLAIVIACFGGVGAARKKENERVWKEIREEFQYFGPSIAVGLLAVIVPATAAGAAIQPPV